MTVARNSKPSSAFRINGGAVGAWASVSHGATVTFYTLVQSGSVGQTVTLTAGDEGTAGILRCEINGGIDLQTEQPSAATRATGAATRARRGVPARPRIRRASTAQIGGVTLDTGEQMAIPVRMSTEMNAGLHVHRLASNDEERAFAEAWVREANQGLLDWLLGPGDRKGDVSERDRIVAATVVQWLGSPVGQAFLRELDYVRVGRRGK